MANSGTILLIEDSSMITKVLRHLMKQELNLPCDSVGTFAETQQRLDQRSEDYFVAIVDLHLPDAPHGEVLDAVIKAGVPAIVLTATFDEGRREDILNKPIVDYVVKEGRHSYRYVARLIQRLERNQRIKVLVADDSETSRNYIRNLLRNHLYQVYTAADGREALQCIQHDPAIKLLIVDYHMPEMDGVELIRLLRHKYKYDDLVIIGLSGHGHASLSARFIKNGANDFLIKPFSQEEFHCRIMQNIEVLETRLRLHELAIRDHLTGLYNRRHLFEVCGEQYLEARRHLNPFTVAVVDIDHFKSINDSYGHEVGDRVIALVADRMQAYFSGSFVARLGGEEFGVVFAERSLDAVRGELDAFREEMASKGVELTDYSLGITVSIGATDDYGDTFNDMIKRADELLYASKEGGRNQLTLIE
ncbi:diguanylate cyclase [Halomonadaceae bacterium KBTZ08]